MICTFPSIQAAVDTCTSVMQMGIPVARMEMMDENTIDAVNKFCNLDNLLRPTLIVEHHGSPSEIDAQSALVQEIARDFEAEDIALATSPDERKSLWRGRHAVWHAILVRSTCRSTRWFSGLTDVVFKCRLNTLAVVGSLRMLPCRSRGLPM